MEPTRLKDNDGEVVMSGIHTYGDTIHLFIERKIITVHLCQATGHGITLTSNLQILAYYMLIIV